MNFEKIRPVGLLAFTALLFMSGILYSNTPAFFYLISFIGIVFAFKFRNQMSFGSSLNFFYYLALLFLTYLITNILLSQPAALFEWRFAAYQLILFLPLIAIVFFLIRFDEQMFWKMLIVASSFSFIWLLLLIYNGMPTRGTGLLEDAINRGNMSMLFGLMSLVSFFAVRSVGWKLLALVFFVTGVTLSLVSGSRGGWGALLLSVVTIGFILYKYRLKKQLLILSGLILVASVLLFFALDHLPVVDRINLAINDIKNYLNGNYHSSVGYRLYLWDVAIKAFLEHPLFGWGWSEFNAAHQYLLNEGVVGKARLFGHAHSQYFLFLAEIGAIGIVLFMSFFLYPSYKAILYLRSNFLPDSKLYFAMLTIVMTEALLEFMLTDDTFSKPYFVVVFLVISLSFFYFSNQVRHESNRVDSLK